MKQYHSTIVLVHGFNVRDGGANTIDRLKPYLDDHQIIEADYGWIGLLGVRLFSKNLINLLAGMTPKHSIGIGHSNGCTKLVAACEKGAPFDRLILINPALDRDYQFPLQLQRIDVFHNLDDTAVAASRFLPFHSWGDMGRVGYMGTDRRVHNHETRSLFGVSGHSAIFSRAASFVSYLKDKLALNEHCSNCGRI